MASASVQATDINEIIALSFKITIISKPLSDTISIPKISAIRHSRMLGWILVLQDFKLVLNSFV